MKKTILLASALLSVSAFAATPPVRQPSASTIPLEDSRPTKPTSELAEMLSKSRCMANRDSTTGEINGYRCLDEKGNLKNEFITADGRRITFDSENDDETVQVKRYEKLAAPRKTTIENKDNSLELTQSLERNAASAQNTTAGDDYQIQLKPVNGKRFQKRTPSTTPASFKSDAARSRPRAEKQPANRFETSSLDKAAAPQKFNVAVELNRMINNTNMQMRQDVTLTEGQPLSIQGRSPSNKRLVIQLAATIPNKATPNVIQLSSRIYEYVNGKPVLIGSPSITASDNTEATVKNTLEDNSASMTLKVKPKIIVE